ncbi:MAG: hypothetical protein KAH20_09300 [Methylococcales bacterium]|nr:hypothetical protein [Methylococcales bacterium]
MTSFLFSNAYAECGASYSQDSSHGVLRFNVQNAKHLNIMRQYLDSENKHVVLEAKDSNLEIWHPVWSGKASNWAMERDEQSCIGQHWKMRNQGHGGLGVIYIDRVNFEGEYRSISLQEENISHWPYRQFKLIGMGPVQ